MPSRPGPATHLQFRRFAGWPICNLHLHSVVARHAEITASGIDEVVVFHSTPEELRSYTDDLPFGVVADPAKKLYTPPPPPPPSTNGAVGDVTGLNDVPCRDRTDAINCSEP